MERQYQRRQHETEKAERAAEREGSPGRTRSTEKIRHNKDTTQYQTAKILKDIVARGIIRERRIQETNARKQRLLTEHERKQQLREVEMMKRFCSFVICSRPVSLVQIVVRFAITRRTEQF